MYSKEAVESVQQRGISVAELAKWRKDMATARQTDVMTQQLPATFKALEQFATGGTPQAPTGETAPTTRQPRRLAPSTHGPARVRERHYGGESALPAGLDHPHQVDYCGRVQL